MALPRRVASVAAPHGPVVKDLALAERIIRNTALHKRAVQAPVPRGRAVKVTARHKRAGKFSVRSGRPQRCGGGCEARRAAASSWRAALIHVG